MRFLGGRGGAQGVRGREAPSCHPAILPACHSCTQEADKQRLLAARAEQQEEASGVLAEVSEVTSQNQALNKTFMALAGERSRCRQRQACRTEGMAGQLWLQALRHRRVCVALLMSPGALNHCSARHHHHHDAPLPAWLASSPGCLAGEVKSLKAQCNSLADAAQAEKFELLAAKQENERLQDQIVQVCVLVLVFGVQRVLAYMPTQDTSHHSNICVFASKHTCALLPAPTSRRRSFKRAWQS